MDDTPDYQHYSLEELYDVAQHIDREKYPERYALVVEQIANQERQRKENPSAFQDSNEAKGGCVGGCSGAFVGAALGIAAAIFWLYLFPPPHVPNMDGMNQWGGHMGLVMMGILVGGICGACYGASKRR